MKAQFLTISMIVFFSHALLSQHFDKARLDAYFNILEEKDRFMGGVAISKEGEILYTKTVGFADIENHIKADRNTKYRTGSVTKTFTAVLVLKAVEENLIALDQTIEGYFPTVPNAEKITIEHLLRHRSGIHNFTDDADYRTWNTEARSEREMIRIIAMGGRDFKPGGEAQYSNANYILLTFLLEQVYQKPYAELLMEHIIQPLGLSNTYLGSKINTKNNECHSYRYANTWERASETHISIPLGAGGIVSTPTDLVAFIHALFNGKLLNAESLDQMRTFIDNFGIGLFQFPFYDNTGYGHTGGIDGFSSVFCYFPEGEIAYAMTSNGANYNTNNISIAVLSAAYNKPYEMPAIPNYNVPPEDLEKYPGIYASAQVPLKITITKDKNKLFAQATGQSAFPLEATGKDVFRYEQAGIVMTFQPADSTMILEQGGGQFTFKRE